MSTSALILVQRAGENLSKRETLSLLRMGCLLGTRIGSIDFPDRMVRNSSNSFFSTSSCDQYGLEELIPRSPTWPTGNTGKEDVRSTQDSKEEIARQHQASNATVVGQAWTADLLRRKSWDDLHGLWISLYKERNSLHAEKLVWKKLGHRMPQATRLSKVKLSMNRVKQVMSERMRLEDDPKIREYIKAFINAM